jgi:WD40 repeat protein
MELADGAEPAPDGFPSASQRPSANSATAAAASPSESAQAIDPLHYTPKTLKLVLHRRGRLSFQECVEIGLALATALEHLHQHGLIHRDIKPSNVIFAGGVPKLADIGLVTDVGASISYVGTEGFLPPEGPGTPRADLYSLGKVLYEMCTGRDRFDFPELPTFTQRSEAKNQLLELNQIFLKACQNDPRKRYASAQAMRADFALLHSGRSLRRARERARHLVWAQSVALGVVVAAALVMLALWLRQQRQFAQWQQERDVSNRAQRLSSSLTRETTEQLTDVSVLRGEEFKQEGDYLSALLWLSRALAQEPPNSDRRPSLEQRLRDVWTLCPIPIAILTHATYLTSASFSANESRIITAGDAPAALIWDATRWVPIAQLKPPAARLELACLSPDGQSALTLDAEGNALFWTLLPPAPFSSGFTPAEPLRFAQFRSDRRQLLGISRAGHVLVWEVSSRRLHFTLKGDAPLREASFSPDNQTIATLDETGQPQMWETDSGRLLATVAAKFSKAAGLTFSPDSRRVALRAGASAHVWETRSGLLNPRAFTHDAPLHSLSFNLTGDSLATAGEDRAVYLWDLSTGARLGAPWHHPGPVQRVTYSPDGQSLASACGRQVRFVRNTGAIGVAALNARTQVLATFSKDVVDLAFSPSGHLLLAASADGTARCFLVNQTAGWLPPPGGPDKEWTSWAQLLAGRRFGGEEGLVPLTPREQEELWNRIGAPARGTLAAHKLVNWHRHEAEACETRGAWPAALFHWKAAAALQPGESSFRDGVARANANTAKQPAGRQEASERHVPERSPEASPRQLDLTSFYNASLRDTWLPTNVVASGNDLSELPVGLNKFGGISFDVRGIIQLSGTALETLGGRFPREITNIPVHQTCRRLHFLHGAGWSALAGVPIATYLLHYADGETAEVRVVYGRHLREWWSPATAAPVPLGAAVAWEGANAATRAVGMKLRLYQMTWPNPRPNVEIASIDFRSTMEYPAPFLLAVTTE